MKLKYKKIILLVTMSSMGIGLITLSLSNPKGKEPNNVKQQTILSEQQEDKEEEQAETGIIKITDGLTDDGTLLENAYPDINELIKKYLEARVACDMDTIKNLVSSTSTISLETLQKESEYIESYNNISCYTIKAPDNESFVVYVYEELKIVGIDTLAPGMIRLYVRVNPDGKPVIYFGQVEDETIDFIEATGNDIKVIQLIESVNKKLEEAMTSDKNLKAFIEGLENTAKNISKEKVKE
ncbi:hypothetical protein EDD66_102316 [Mobilisporobacter senegalensis]|uniref:Uncharacterized protein n=1 Tax=Mobilisporobacter senegalensis TaxID=1329262 RepID=A0A3N1XWT1_9FIRM|nr:hypothetical protein [Mobilisporobacter senegalensis]ROR30661.1 hypothetical protein EDD66_102316 [Mobilisporobacter senegalensis]